MRIIALYLIVAGLALYAWRDWFRALCGLIVLLAVVESGDMPRTIAGVQGLNLWNLLLASVVLAWAACRRGEKLRWDMPRHVTWLLLLFTATMIVSFVRAYLDREMLGLSRMSVIGDCLVNTFKWLIPAVLLFDGCRTRERLIWAGAAILTLIGLLGVQVYLTAPIEGFWNVERLRASRLKFDRRIGYNAVDLAALLAGGIWAFFALAHYFRGLRRAGLLAVSVLMLGALALTGGRAGLVTFATVGLTLCLLRWRRYLLLVPAAALLLTVVLPGPTQRILQGFREVTPTGGEEIALQTVTSDRSLIWPPVMEKIARAPMIGYGRRAMERTGLSYYVYEYYGNDISFGHPHNVYLEWWLDNGLLGLIPVLILFGVVVRYSARLFRSANPTAMVVGGGALSLALAQLIAGIGSQHFYPTEGNLAVWAGMFLMFRVHVETQKRQTARPVRQGSPMTSAP